MYRLSASELHQGFKEGKYTAHEIISYFIKRIKALDPQIKAFLSIHEERVFQKAKLLDEKKARGETFGRLAGIPIAIKDNMQVKGEITTCGSKFLTNYKAPYDATLIELLEKEDALILGKTNLDEFAMGSSTENSAFFPTNNPWDLERVPGGSSGGSAAAVAARLCPVSFGSDTGGSIRQPAAFTGTVGFKPTYGRVSRFGLVAFGSSLDQIGPFTNCINDTALMMEVIGRHDEKDSTSIPEKAEPYLDELKTSIQGKKVGVPWHFLTDLRPEVKENFLKSLDALKDLGVDMCEIHLDMLKYSIPMYYILAPAEASTNLARFDGIRYGLRSKKAKTLDEIYDLSKQEGFGKEVKRRILLGTFVLSAGYQDAFYKKAQKIRTLLIEEYKRAYLKCDIIAMPTTPETAFKQGAIQDPITMYRQDLFTISANIAGLPAISLPSGFNAEGLPFGLQLIGPQLEDARVLRFASHLEKTLGTQNAIPTQFDKEVNS